MSYFDEFSVGDVYQTIHRTISDYELGTFVGLTGFFEEFFISTPSAEQHPLAQQRFVPGQLTLVLAEGLYILTGRLARGIALLGITDVAWRHPVRVGDTIAARIEVTATRTTRSPGRGIVNTRHDVLNQEGDVVMTYTAARMIRTRS